MLAQSMGQAHGGCRLRIGFLSHQASPEIENADNVRCGHVRATLFQCDAEAYCWRVAPQQGPLPLRLPAAKLQKNDGKRMFAERKC